jgi:hypothetical protein
MSQPIIDAFKKFDWQKIIDYANSLSDLNDAQLRFIKGLAIEIATETFSNSDIEYVGEKHRDFEWPEFDVDVELKTIVSQGMYNKKGEVKTLPGIRLNNSMGTNKAVLDPDNIADWLLVVLRDGAFAVPKQTVLTKAKHCGDGWDLKLTKNDIIEVSGRITKQKQYSTKLSESIRDAIKQSLSGL